MPSFSIEHSFEVYCATCGAGLCNQSTVVETHTRHAPSVRVAVCQKCLDDADDKGYQRGYAEGIRESPDV